jgi:Raf kinase inhibitor-like YbhB/YbcL family protein
MRHAHGVSWLAVAVLVSGLPTAATAGQPDPAPGALALTSPAFAQGQAIPSRYTDDGENTSPPLVVAGAPHGTVSLALIVEDPDAPVGTWVHWVVWDLPAGTHDIAAGKLPEGALEGRNSWGRNVYGGPAPPSGTHRYFFRLFALDVAPDLPPRAGAAALRRAMSGHVLATAELMGTYHRR